jgi:hypothetical protein
MVPHTCNLNYLGVGGGGDQEGCGLRPTQAKLVRPPSQSISQVWWDIPVIPATMKAVGRKIKVRGHPGQKN